MAFVLANTVDGKKITTYTASLANTGTAAADVRATVYIPNVQRVIAVLGVVRKDANNAGVVVNGIVSPNGVDITAQSVPAGATTRIDITVLAI